jgi:hypothetical protein
MTNPAIYGSGNLQSSSIRIVLDLSFPDSVCLYSIIGMALFHRHISERNETNGKRLLCDLNTSYKPVATALRYLSRSTKLLQDKINRPEDATSDQSIITVLILLSFMVNIPFMTH